MVEFYFVGGPGYGGEVYEAVTGSGYGNLTLPFYLAMEPNGDAHGVLIETNAPFLTQFVEAPGLLFHFQGQNVGIQLHIFVGPSPSDVYGQLHEYVRIDFTLPTTIGLRFIYVVYIKFIYNFS